MFRGMSQNIVSRIPGHQVSVYRNRSEAFSTPSDGMRFVLRIGCQVPFQYIAAPVPGSANNQRTDMPRQILFKITRSTYPLFGKIEILFRMGIMNRRKGFNRPAIKMKRRTIDILCRLRIIKDC